MENVQYSICCASGEVKSSHVKSCTGTSSPPLLASGAHSIGFRMVV